MLQIKLVRLEQHRDCPELAVALSEQKLALSVAEWAEGVVEVVTEGSKE